MKCAVCGTTLIRLGSVGLGMVCPKCSLPPQPSNPITEAMKASYFSRDEEIKNLKSHIRDLERQHEDLVTRNAFLRERPDLPADRIPAYEKMVARIERLELEKTSLIEIYKSIREKVWDGMTQAEVSALKAHIDTVLSSPIDPSIANKMSRLTNLLKRALAYIDVLQAAGGIVVNFGSFIEDAKAAISDFEIEKAVDKSLNEKTKFEIKGCRECRCSILKGFGIIGCIFKNKDNDQYPINGIHSDHIPSDCPLLKHKVEES